MKASNPPTFSHRMFAKLYGAVQESKSQIEKPWKDHPENPDEAVQKCARLVDLKKTLQKKPFVAKIGVDTAESGPSKA